MCGTVIMSEYIRRNHNLKVIEHSPLELPHGMENMVKTQFMLVYRGTQMEVLPFALLSKDSMCEAIDN